MELPKFLLGDTDFPKIFLSYILIKIYINLKDDEVEFIEEAERILTRQN
jgi:hypothetical protein